MTLNICGRDNRTPPSAAQIPYRVYRAASAEASWKRDSSPYKTHSLTRDINSGRARVRRLSVVVVVVVFLRVLFCSVVFYIISDNTLIQ